MKKKISFEEGMQELEMLVKSLESGQMSLEESFKAYERAVKLRDSLSAILDDSEKKIGGAKLMQPCIYRNRRKGWQRGFCEVCKGFWIP